MEQNIYDKYTFWKLISDYDIIIPIMQRDYAQGRVSENVTAIRAELLDSIYNSLLNENNINFDFIYGSLEKNTLLPLDGQQRLTTLFLLHWYLASKEGYIDESRVKLHKFSYRTRISSRDFCDMLVELEYIPREDELPSEFIIDQNSYFQSWNNDPTIAAMLVMLDAIHNRFFVVEKKLFPLLLDEENPIITFNYLPMENYALTDDLYIKMNARGKGLSDFENFKAKFIQHLKQNKFDYKYFENKIDKEWTDLFWDYRSAKDNTIDKQFMYVFTYFTEMLYLEFSDRREGDSPFSPDKIRKLIAFYDTEEKVNELYQLLDIWSNKFEVDECLDSLFSVEYCFGKVRLFDSDNNNLFEEIIKGTKLSNYNKVLLYSVMKRLIYYKEIDEIDDSLTDYTRVVRNLILKSRQFIKNNASYTSDFRFCRHGIPYIDFILDKLLSVHDIYNEIINIFDDRINGEALKTEKQTANAILNHPDLKNEIHHLEDLDIFKTCIHNILPSLIKYQRDKFTEQIIKIFSKQYYETTFRALLSVGDFGIYLGGKEFGVRYFYGDRGRWINILSASDDDIEPIINDFVGQFFDSEQESTIDKLNEIITNNDVYGIDDWKYYFIKYPSMIKQYEGVMETEKIVLLFEEEENGIFSVPHRLKGSTLQGYHICALYLEVMNRINDDLVEFNREKGREGLGEIVVGGRVEIKCTVNGPELYYIGSSSDDEDREVADKMIADNALEIYESKYSENMDYVERLELLCDSAIASYKEYEELL